MNNVIMWDSTRGVQNAVFDHEKGCETRGTLSYCAPPSRWCPTAGAFRSGPSNSRFGLSEGFPTLGVSQIGGGRARRRAQRSAAQAPHHGLSGFHCSQPGCACPLLLAAHAQPIAPRSCFPALLTWLQMPRGWKLWCHNLSTSLDLKHCCTSPNSRLSLQHCATLHHLHSKFAESQK